MPRQPYVRHAAKHDVSEARFLADRVRDRVRIVKNPGDQMVPILQTAYVRIAAIHATLIK